MDPIAAIDADVVALRQAWRRSRAALAGGEAMEAAAGQLSEEQCALVSDQAQGGDPVARALLPWAAALHEQCRDWPRHRQRAAHWAADGPGSLAPLRSLRRQWLTARDASAREHAAGEFCASASAVSAFELDSIKRRRDETEGGTLEWVAGHKTADVASLATRFLADSDDMARELPAGGWHERLRLALCTAASEGWPARLTSRWIEAVFAGTNIAEGVRIGPIALPPIWGASSFGRALGRFAIALLEGCRPANLPLALHEHPHGTRRFVSYDLFASLIGDRAFAKHVLGLGAARAREHERLVARSRLRHLRLEALRALLWIGLERGPLQAEAVIERASELSERALGHPLPPSLLAVTPTLDDAAGARWVGALEAASVRHDLIAAFDEDWHRNPHAIAEIRERHNRSRGGSEAKEHAAAEGLGKLATHLAQALG
jgi:hypothetical protein